MKRTYLYCCFFIFRQHFFGEKSIVLARCVPVETFHETSLVRANNYSPLQFALTKIVVCLRRFFSRGNEYGILR